MLTSTLGWRRGGEARTAVLAVGADDTERELAPFTAVIAADAAFATLAASQQGLADSFRRRGRGRTARGGTGARGRARSAGAAAALLGCVGALVGGPVDHVVPVG